MKKISSKIAVLAEDLYQVLEVWYPLLRLKEEHLDVVSIGTGTKKTYASKEGYPINVDASIDEVKASDFIGVIIPGGYAPDILRRYPKIVNFIKDIHKANGIVGAICHGGWLLVSADIIRGKRVTCFFAIKDDLIAAGAEYIDQEVVVDGNIVTSRKPEDLPRFMQEIIKLAKEKINKLP
ncbi:MAG: type 1 glutamine amidotransferase domain-containing protein [Candidatus Omnitrophota bacterium]